MISHNFIFSFVLHLILLTIFVVVSSETPFGNDLAGSCQSLFLFKCSNGECISKSFVCDGRPDCADGSDENCPQEKSRRCRQNLFECDNGRCIPMYWHCDGSADCDDGSDERRCEVKCPYNEFKCRSGKCVVASSLCDGEKDCEAGEDEEHCGKAHCSSISGFYQCDSGDCVPPSKVCDNTTDCEDGTDEGLACASICKANNCTEGCYQTPKGPHCSCRNGFSLRDDLSTCADENECERRHMLVCDHFCKNTNGSFRCSCHSSYTLQKDGLTCKHKRPGDAFLLVAQQGSIRQLFLDGSRFTQIYSGGNRSVVGLGFDPATRRVFWGTRRRILAVSLTENALPKTILKNGIIMAEGLAVDWTARNLYIADPRMFHILVCTLDGSACYQLLTGLGHPRTIQLDMVHRYMYWTDVKHRSISKAGMDGSHPTVLVQDGLVWPNGLALDLPAGRLYWLDAQRDEAHSARLDGTDRKTLHLATVNHPYSMALWEDRLYWTDWTRSHIVSCIKRDGKHVKTELKGTHKQQYFGLVLYHPAMMEPINNPCSYAQCSHLCLLSPHSPGYTCACPTGVMQLDEDKHTCIDLPDRIFVMVNSFKRMYLVSPHYFGLSDQRAWMSHLQIMDIGDVEYFPGQDLVFVSDQYEAKIYLINMKTDASTILLNNTVARKMALDWMRHNLYWLDSDYKVQVMRLITGKGSHRTAVITALSAPLDIAVAPLAGLLFVSSASSGPQSQAHIQWCGLDGSHCYTLVATQIRMPLSLAVDHKHNHLYWCDSSLGRIERINFSGTKRTLILPPTELALPSAVVSLMITGDFLSWTVENERTFFTIRTDHFPSGALKITDLYLDPDERKMLKLTRVKWELPKEMREQQRPCYDNGGCSEICVGNRLHKEVCLCGFSSILGSDGKTCEKGQCRVDQFQCVSSSRCIPAKWKCDGSPDCSDGSDEVRCPFFCKLNFHQCGTTDVCVHKSKVCDGKPDCDDGSDEGDSCSTVLPEHCPNDHLCDKDRCLPQPFVCDGHVDCGDESDESNCTHVACPVGKVKCRRGGCVAKFWVCDGDKDCPDGSDEENCTVTCPTGQFPCDTKCIAVNATCDGKNDCEDGKDEVKWMCEAQRNLMCPEGKIACLLNTPTADLLCFGHEEQCNGVFDCPLGEDESHYLCTHCKRSEFQCPTNNVCIPLRYLCDGEPDCEDGADEGEAANCTLVTTITTTLQTLVTQRSHGHCRDDFLCEDGECVPNSKVCDGRRDCYDGSDEQQSCEVRCDVMKCEHNCRSTPNKAYCSCNLGYHLAPDLHSCLDDEECVDEGRCSHGCEEQPGSFQCTCLPGYRLLDQTTCKREVGEDWLAVAVHQGIFNYTHTYHLQGVYHSLPSVIFTSFTSFAVDPTTGDFLYSDGHRQVVSKLLRFPDGVMKEEVFLRERSFPRSVCYDPQRRNLYVAELFGGSKGRHERSDGGSRNHGDKNTTTYTENLWSSIMACNLDGKGCSVVFGTNVSVVMSVAVAVTEKLLFFCTRYFNFEAGQLMTSYLDGTEINEIWKKMVWCSHIAVDEAKHRVYWTDLTLETVETVTWEGVGHRHVHRQQEVWFPVGLAVVGPNVVWANRGSNFLLLCPKLPDRGECSKIEHPSAPLGLFAAPLPFLPEQEECGNVSCSQLCASGGSGCLCLAGYRRSNSDPTKCEKLTTCDSHQCEGGSTCEAHTDEHYVCRCPEGRFGLRCEFGEAISKASNAATTTIVVVVLVMVMLLLVFLYWWKRCPFTIWKRRGHGNGEQGYHFVNPAFGVIHDQPIIEAEAQPARGNNVYPRLPYYPPPPYAPPPRSSSLLQNTVGSPAAKDKESQINTSGDSAVASTTDSILASQHSEVNLATPFCQHPTKMKDEEDLSEFDYSPFNPSKV